MSHLCEWVRQVVVAVAASPGTILILLTIASLRSLPPILLISCNSIYTLTILSSIRAWI